ncbi:hypothetical protein AVEN_154943-1 [Araneus ventricosus]|uniref:Uncharacterized protein n=1 Tax=Araneus ventricosus TaxID=182803 RepID=A0A4Y2A8R6_ARAVE|nr:hypothetical protein AVEN_154943-1 [Araneus ventricosus]
MCPDFTKPRNESKIQEIIRNEVSYDERTAIVDSSEYSNDFSPDCSAEGLKDLAGYIAHRCRKYDRSLAITSGQILVISSHEKTWIEVLSKRGLLVPTDEWCEQIKKIEQTFLEMHGSNYLSIERNVISNLCLALKEKFPSVSEEIIKIYSRTRTFIRLRWLNVTLITNKIQRGQLKRTKKWDASHCQSSKM